MTHALPNAGLYQERYELGPSIATGGMATVYRAFDRVALRPIAYKRLSSDHDGDSRIAALFQREYDTLARLRHPNIVEVYDFGADASGPYYTMELISGASVKSLAPLPFRDACRLIRDVASALALVHTRRLAHRDVSPRNVLRLSDGRAKLIDFGALSPFGVPKEIVGTPAYIAPESFNGLRIDQRADLYALGALAYLVLTKTPHVRARGFDDLAAAWLESPLPPSALVADVPRALDELVLALLRIDPAARPSTAAEVIERVTAIADLAPEHDESRIAYSYLQHAPLQGRETAMSMLSASASAALSGRGCIAVVEAEQGLGRTALLDHLSIEAQLAGATVLRTRGGLHASSFGAARRLVDAGLGMFPALAQTLRRISSSPHSSSSSGDDETDFAKSAVGASERRGAVAALLSEALLALSRRAPLVLLIDDAHLADAETLGLLAALADSLEECSVLIVMSSLVGRSTQHPVAYENLRGRAQCCVLTSLTKKEVLEVVETVFGNVPNADRLATWLHTQTGGNPGHCVDLLHQLLADGSIRYTVGTFTLPLDIDARSATDRHATAELPRLAGLPEKPRRVAYLLGVHDGALTLEQLVRASHLGPSEVAIAVEELVQRGAVIWNGNDLACRSEPMRKALQELQDIEQRRSAHRALARALDFGDQGDVDAVIAAARHRISCGGDEALRGARALASIDLKHRFELASSRSHLAALEDALEVLDRHSVPDEECLGLLIPLSFAGLSGDLAIQGKYAERTVRRLSMVCGATRATGLSPYLGKKVAFVVGLGSAAIRFMVTRKRVYRGSFLQHVQDLCAVTTAASGALAAVYETAEVERFAHSLDPFAAFSVRSAPALLRELCLASRDIVRGRIAAARERYGRLAASLERPVFGFDDSVRELMRCGAMLGMAQALVTDASPRALEVADELERSSAFFVAHADGVRTTFFAYRGEIAKAEMHKRRAQSTAFQTGLWPVLTMMELRWVLACVITGDQVRLVRSVSDLRHLAHVSAGLVAVHEVAQAHLELLRGHPERALPVYERVLEPSSSRLMPTYATDRALHAQALAATGDNEGARKLCLDLIEEIQVTGHDSLLSYMLCQIELALAEAKCGRIERGVDVLEQAFDRIRAPGNPLWLGMWHRTRATLASLARDRPTFVEHLDATERLFRGTCNPCLIQQCDVLRTEAVRTGLITDVARKTTPRVVATQAADENSETRAMNHAGPASRKR